LSLTQHNGESGQAGRNLHCTSCYAVVGVVGEWTEEGSAAYSKGKKIEIGGLFGAAKNVRPFKESERQLSLLRACKLRDAV
jgi:hypothetical protein